VKEGIPIPTGVVFWIATYEEKCTDIDLKGGEEAVRGVSMNFPKVCKLRSPQHLNPYLCPLPYGGNDMLIPSLTN
jgi:hypothetical protein